LPRRAGQVSFKTSKTKTSKTKTSKTLRRLQQALMDRQKASTYAAAQHGTRQAGKSGDVA
jgi:5,10-methylenetetrahydrofolate reductase